MNLQVLFLVVIMRILLTILGPDNESPTICSPSASFCVSYLQLRGYRKCGTGGKEGVWFLLCWGAIV